MLSLFRSCHCSLRSQWHLFPAQAIYAGFARMHVLFILTQLAPALSHLFLAPSCLSSCSILLLSALLEAAQSLDLSLVECSKAGFWPLPLSLTPTTLSGVYTLQNPPPCRQSRSTALRWIPNSILIKYRHKFHKNQSTHLILAAFSEIRNGFESSQTPLRISYAPVLV